MLQIRYKLIVLKLLTTVMLFASLAPTVSHALVSFTGNTGFTQRICTTNAQGETTVQQVEKTIVLQVKTTMGQQLSTALTIKADALNVQDSQSINSHFEHCPFCLNHAADVLTNSQPTNLVFIASGKFFLQHQYLSPVLSALHLSDHPSRAPPFSV